MKKIFSLSIFAYLILQSSVFATTSTDYLQEIYSKTCNKEVTIKSKKEFIDKYEQKLGDKFISSIAYGEADFKLKGARKKRVSYVCMLENDCTPIWGYILPR